MQHKHTIRSIEFVGEQLADMGTQVKRKVWAIKVRKYNLDDEMMFLEASDAIDAWTKATKKLETYA